MSVELRAVFDTNAIVGALLFEQSVPAQAFFAASDRGTILVSEVIFREETFASPPGRCASGPIDGAVRAAVEARP